MQTSVTFKNLDPSDHIKSYVSDKLNRFDKYLYNPAEANVVLSVEKFRHIAEINIIGDRLNINGKEETEDMYSSIDQVMDKLEKQVKKYLSKIRNRRTDNRKGEESLGVEETEEYAAFGLEGPSIEVEKMIAKPMDPEEAAMQLSTSQQDFIVFRNSRSEQINVIYKRKDGNFGLLEPSS